MHFIKIKIIKSHTQISESKRVPANLVRDYTFILQEVMIIQKCQQLKLESLRGQIKSEQKSVRQMLMHFLLQCLKTYMPLLYGVYLCVNKQTSNKVSIEKVIKFVVIRVILSLFQHIMVDLVNFNESLAQFFMLLIYLYLTLYNYAYAEALYNIVIAPFMNIFSQLVSNVDNDVQSHKRKLNLVKAMEHQKERNSSQNIKIQPIGYVKRSIHNTFNDPLTFPQTDQ